MLMTTQNSSNDQKDFWNSLQMELGVTNQEISLEDLQALIERSFMFSLFFRGCPAFEIAGFQKMLHIKSYGYLILLAFSEKKKANLYNVSIDEFDLHHSIKKILANTNHTIGPYITNRISILITEDFLPLEKDHKESSIVLCRKLTKQLGERYNVDVYAGIGSLQSISSIYTSFIDAMGCLYYGNASAVVHYSDLISQKTEPDFDYALTERLLMEAVRLRRIEAYDYFSLMMNHIKQFSDVTKRNKILELLVMAYHAISQDSNNNAKYLDYTESIIQLMECSGTRLIDCAFQIFIYITSFVKPQNSIDYSNHIVMATKEYLENHYADDISLEDMAAHVNISPQYFSKLIKKNTGFNFIDWLSMLRVKKAKELLTNSNLTVKEVCFMVGYKDPNYFSRIFKKRIGITPSEYIIANGFGSEPTSSS